MKSLFNVEHGILLYSIYKFSPLHLATKFVSYKLCG